MSPLLRFALELGPLAVFFIANTQAGIYWATGLFMIAVVVALAVNYAMERRLPTMPLVTAVMVLVFGGLTLLLEDDLFIKLKPTIVNLLFAATLFTGLAMKRNFIKLVLEHALKLDESGWRKLTWRWAWFFVFLAILNEIVWRTQSTDVWVNFKVFGIMPLTLAFSFMQLPLINRHMIHDDANEPASSDLPRKDPAPANSQAHD